MKIILLDSVDNLGEKGEVKEVKKGYFRNFLFPRNLAKIATDEEILKIEAEMKRREEKEAEELKELQSKADKLKSNPVTIEARLIAGRKLFGSIKGKEIAQKLGLKSKQIKILSPIKAAGEHKVIINLGRGVKTEVVVNIVSKRKRKK
ncbi:MAG: large subunit ribosomal protein L9 [Candidatus Berkelbacteria bacterium Licking1014_96]|uniref:Large ribosomal subunit protein bL9 n=1 Tax=Candidatus Berkelbacteria bacterium Licking1014_96 TaxID=2017149 RepID=A0A554LD49_9BACT|nr:MAG: large subunit ribosomal protein L9 [Candidatus Berkelbacteria bacterium Licking1014_96]